MMERKLRRMVFFKATLEDGREIGVRINEFELLNGVHLKGKNSIVEVPYNEFKSLPHAKKVVV